MKMIVFDRMHTALGRLDLVGALLVINANGFENKETLRVVTVHSGFPDYYWLRSESGKFDARYAFEDPLPWVGSDDQIVFFPGHLKITLFPHLAPIHSPPALAAPLHPPERPRGLRGFIDRFPHNLLK
jgi:hypothetical protein